jgi:spermidine/putrescine transport system substrate-binding protein
MTRINRRGFLRAAGWAGGAFALAGCGAPVVREAVDRSRLASSLRVYSWSNYLSPTLTSKFQSEFGVPVTVAETSNNEEIETAIRSSTSHGYDVIIIADYMVAKMIAEGLLQSINYGNVPGQANQSPANINLYYDPTSQYSTPYFWGTTGLLINTAVSPRLTRWQQVFEIPPPFNGGLGLLDDVRETLGMALRALGFSSNTTNPTEIDAAGDALRNLVRDSGLTVYFGGSGDVSNRVASGELAVGLCYAPDAVVARGRDARLDYGLLEPRSTLWQDNLAIPLNAPGKYTAEVFINFMLQPENAAQNARDVGAATPNAEVTRRRLLDDAILNDKSRYPDLVAGRFEWIERLPADVLQRYEDAFARARS